MLDQSETVYIQIDQSSGSWSYLDSVQSSCTNLEYSFSTINQMCNVNEALWFPYNDTNMLHIYICMNRKGVGVEVLVNIELLKLRPKLYQSRYNPSDIKVNQAMIHRVTIPRTIIANTTGRDIDSYQTKLLIPVL